MHFGGFTRSSKGQRWAQSPAPARLEPQQRGHRGTPGSQSGMADFSLCAGHHWNAPAIRRPLLQDVSVVQAEGVLHRDSSLLWAFGLPCL